MDDLNASLGAKIRYSPAGLSYPGYLIRDPGCWRGRRRGLSLVPGVRRQTKGTDGIPRIVDIRRASGHKPAQAQIRTGPTPHVMPAEAVSISSLAGIRQAIARPIERLRRPDDLVFVTTGVSTGLIAPKLSNSTSELRVRAIHASSTPEGKS